MRGPSIISSALAARSLFMLPLLIRVSFATTSTTNVQDGDTFLAIANSAGIPVESLEAANPGVAASDLYVGQAINVPAGNNNDGPAPDDPASQMAMAAAATTLATFASPPVSSDSSSPSGSLSLAPPVSASSPPSGSSSPTTMSDSSAAASSSSSIDTSSSPSSTAAAASASTSAVATSTPSSTSAPSSTSTSTAISSPHSSTPTAASSTPSISTTAVSSTLSTSTTAASSKPSSTSVPTSTSSPQPSSTTPPPPPPPPSSTSTPNSPPVTSCAPAPVGPYHDVDDPLQQTNKFCDDNDGTLLADVQNAPGGVIDGSDQSQNKNDGSARNEAGYNMTISALPDCMVSDASVEYPLPLDTASNCSTLLHSAWTSCDNNGMGGSVTAGCLVYRFNADS